MLLILYQVVLSVIILRFDFIFFSARLNYRGSFLATFYNVADFWIVG